MHRMKRLTIIRSIILIFLAVLVNTNIHAQDNVIDEVVWVVGDEAILKSDVEEARLSALYEGRKLDGDPYWGSPLLPQDLWLHFCIIRDVNKVIQGGLM